MHGRDEVIAFSDICYNIYLLMILQAKLGCLRTLDCSFIVFSAIRSI
jgi:hypothetical protein